jgi:hypothetical protein
MFQKIWKNLNFPLITLSVIFCFSINTAEAYLPQVHLHQTLADVNAGTFKQGVCSGELKEISDFLRKNRKPLKKLFHNSPMKEVSFRHIYQKYGMYNPEHAKYNHSEFDRYMKLYRWIEWVPGGPLVFHGQPVTEEEIKEKEKYRTRRIRNLNSIHKTDRAFERAVEKILNIDIASDFHFGKKIREKALSQGYLDSSPKTIIPSVCHGWNDQDLLEKIIPFGNVSADIHPLHKAKIKSSSLSDYFFNEINLPTVGPVRRIESFKFHWSSGDAFKSRIDFVDYDLKTHKLKPGTDIEAIEIVYLDHHVGLFNHIFSRALKLHVDRGIPVKIMVPKGSLWFNLSKDVKAFHERLMSHGIQIHYYKALKFNFFNIFSFFKKLNQQIHTKLTLVRRKGSDDSVLVGGRNSKDAYYFIEDGTDVPYYSNMNRARFQDFDLEVKSEPLSKDAKLLYDELWRVGGKSNKRFKLENLEFSSEENIDPSKGTYARYFMSAPFSKHRDYRTMIVNLINRSQKSIKMVIPYFILETQFNEALKNALKRGVDVTLYTIESFGNDNIPSIAIKTYKDEFRKLIEMGGTVKNYKPDPNDDGLVLHAKISIYDDQVMVTGSGNLDYRSLKHDAENGVVLIGDELLDPFRAEVLEKIEKSSTVYTKENIGAFSRFLAKLLRKNF